MGSPYDLKDLLYLFHREINLVDQMIDIAHRSGRSVLHHRLKIRKATLRREIDQIEQDKDFWEDAQREGARRMETDPKDLGRQLDDFMEGD